MIFNEPTVNVLNDLPIGLTNVFEWLFFNGFRPDYILAKMLYGMVLITLLGAAATPAAKAQKMYNSADTGPVTSIDSLLQVEEYPQHPGSDYYYALKKADIKFERSGESIVAVVEYRVLLKLLTEATRQASIVEIPYYYRQNLESINDIHATTYQPDGSRVRLDTSRVRTINLNAQYNVKEFILPEAQKGSVLEYGYTVRRRYIEELPDFYFAHRMPTAYAEVTLHNPRYLRYKAVPMQFETAPRYRRRLIDTSDVPKIFTVPQPEPLLVEKWNARHISPVKTRSFLPSAGEYRSRIKFQMSEFGIPRQPLENSWELVAAKIRRQSNPLDVLDQKSAIDTLAEKMRQSIDNKKVIQDSLFRFVNARMRYNGNTAISSEMSPGMVLRGQAANQAAVNQALLRLLREAGIEQSWPMLISTAENGSINREFASPLQFNGMLVVTQIQDSTYVMDASYNHSYPGLLPKNMSEGKGMVLKSNTFAWKRILAPHSKNEIRVAVKGRLQPNGDLNAEVRGFTRGYPARLIREKIDNGETAAETMKESFLSGYGNVSIDSASLWHMSDYDRPVELYMKFTLDEYAVDFKSGLKFNPMILGYLSENPFNADSRNVPVILDAREYLTFSYILKLPEQASVESPGRNRNLQIPNGSLSERYKITEDTVAYRYDIVMSEKVYPPETYNQLRSLYQRWVELSQQQWFIRR